MAQHVTLLDYPVEEVIPHGPSKRMIHEILWHAPMCGSIGVYTASASDVADHFGVFRGADQIEALAQASVVPLLAYNESRKMNLSFKAYFEQFVILGAGVGKSVIHDYIKEGERFVIMGKITFYRFRQMLVDGRIYKAPGSIDVHHYFSTYGEDQFSKLKLGSEFKLVSEFKDLVGRAIRREKLR